MNTTRNIATGCALGAAVFVAAALCFAPAYWYLGLLCGMAAGTIGVYLGYDPLVFLRAIPVAWKKTMDVKNVVMRHVTEPRPFGIVSLIFAVLPVAVVSVLIYDVQQPKETSFIILLSVFAGLILWLVFYLLLNAAAWEHGEEKEGFSNRKLYRYWLYRTYGKNFWCEVLDHDMEWELERQLDSGWQPPSQGELVRWMLVGLGELTAWLMGIGLVVCLEWLTIRLPVYAAMGLWWLMCLPFRFAWHLFKLVHTRQHVLCVVDTALVGSGTAVYAWIAHPELTLGTRLFFILCGAVLGAAWGVLNWELVSKRWLKLAPVSSR